MRLDWKSAVGILLSVLILWWVLRGVDPGEIAAVIRNSNVTLFLLCTATATSIFPIRARRWRTILEPAAGRLRFGPLWRSTAIGMMVNNIFPMRAGEIARAYAITREVPSVRLTTALGSLAVDRIFDAIVLLALMFGAMLDQRFPRGVTLQGMTMTHLAATGITLVGVLLVISYLMVLQHERALSAAAWLARRTVPRFEQPLVNMLEHAIGGLAVLRDTRRFLGVLWWALAHWLVHAAGLYLGFMAVGIDAPFSAALFLQGVLGIGVAVPSSPGFFGVFEGAAVLGLSVYGVPRELAISWALGYHILSFIPITVIGAVYFTRLGLHMNEVRRKVSDTA